MVLSERIRMFSAAAQGSDRNIIDSFACELSILRCCPLRKTSLCNVGLPTKPVFETHSVARDPHMRRPISHFRDPRGSINWRVRSPRGDLW